MQHFLVAHCLAPVSLTGRWQDAAQWKVVELRSRFWPGSASQAVAMLRRAVACLSVGGGYRGGGGSGGPIARNEGPLSIMPINSLNSYQNRWTIKARVTNKSDIRRYVSFLGWLLAFQEGLACGRSSRCLASIGTVQQGERGACKQRRSVSRRVRCSLTSLQNIPWVSRIIEGRGGAQCRSYPHDCELRGCLHCSQIDGWWPVHACESP